MAPPPAEALALTGALDVAAELDGAGPLDELLAAGGVLVAELLLGVLDLLEQAASASATVPVAAMTLTVLFTTPPLFTSPVKCCRDYRAARLTAHAGTGSRRAGDAFLSVRGQPGHPPRDQNVTPS
jgi:hypothetical protein